MSEIIAWFLNLSGPSFLGMYIICITLVLISLSNHKDRLAAETAVLKNEPIHIRQDLVRLAYLRGGARHVYLTILAQLSMSGNHTVTEDGRTVPSDETFLRAMESPNSTRYASIYQTVAEYCERNGFLAPIPLDIIATIEEQCEQRFVRELEDSGLRPNDQYRFKLHQARIAAFKVIGGLLALRLFTAMLLNHHNIGFMIILAVTGMVAVWLISRAPNATPAGRQLLREVAAAEGNDQLGTRTACLGLKALAGTEFAFLAGAYANGYYQPKGGGGGSCSGSSCGGGGCGGGCGG